MVCNNGVFYFIRVFITEIYDFLLLLSIGQLRVIQDTIYDSIELLYLIADIGTSTYVLYSKACLPPICRNNTLAYMIKTLKHIDVLIRVLFSELCRELLNIVSSERGISPVLELLRKGCPY